MNSNIPKAAAAVHIIRARIPSRLCLCGGVLATYEMRTTIPSGHLRCTLSGKAVACSWVEFVAAWQADLEHFQDEVRNGSLLAGVRVVDGEFRVQFKDVLDLGEWCGSRVPGEPDVAVAFEFGDP